MNVRISIDAVLKAIVLGIGCFGLDGDLALAYAGGEGADSDLQAQSAARRYVQSNSLAKGTPGPLPATNLTVLYVNQAVMVTVPLVFM